MSINSVPKPITWGEKRRGKVPRYKYVTLSEIYSEKCLHSSQVNVYGIVSDFKEITKSRGIDYYCIVQIIDSTSQIPLKIRLFSRERILLPVVKCGDIIRFHRLKVYKYKSSENDVLLLSTKHWSWVIWEADDTLNHGRAVSETFTVLHSDRERVQNLKSWLTENPLHTFTNLTRKRKRISEINPGDYVDLVCMVVAFKKVSDEQIIAKICDGTLPNHNFFSFEKFPDSEVDNDFCGLPKSYVIDVAVFDNYVEEWIDRMISEKDFITFCNLHAWPNPNHPDNVGEFPPKNGCSELTLHGGTSYDRSVSKSLEEVDEILSVVKKDVDLVQLFAADDRGESRHENILQSPKPSSGRNSFEIISHNKHKKLRKSAINNDVPCTSRVERTNNPTDMNSHFIESIYEKVVHQKPLTEVTGENLPVKLSTLKQITRAQIAVGGSKCFRVRLHINECLVDPDSYVVHFCPPTGQFVPASNTGDPLQLPDKVFDFVEAWRQVRGIDSDATSSEDDDLDVYGITESQWMLPDDSGFANTVLMKHYQHTEDGSVWESFERKEHVIRKRKLGLETFTIIYLLEESEDYGPGNLSDYGSSYNRVIRFVPLSLLKSRNPPAVAYQDGVYYYCSAEYVQEPRLPSLKYEAKWFAEHKVIHVMGSPTYFLTFMIFFVVRDETGEIGKLVLKQEEAENFFLGVTPQKFLLNSDESSTAVRRYVQNLIEKQPCIECIIEKRSLQSVWNDKESNPIYLMKNTRTVAPNII